METLGKAANRFSTSVNALEVLQGEETGGFEGPGVTRTFAIPSL